MKSIIAEIYKQKASILEAQKIERRCEWFDSFTMRNEKEMATSSFHRLGIQFCQRYNFPSLDVFQKMDTQKMQSFGWYIDAEEVEIHNTKEVLLIGGTNATVYCERDGCKIVVMHNAKVNIVAKGAVIIQLFYNDGCEVSYQKSEASMLYVSKNCEPLNFCNTL